MEGMMRKKSEKKLTNHIERKLKISIIICYFMTLLSYFLLMVLLHQVQFHLRTHHQLTHQHFVLLYHQPILIITKNQDFNTVFHQKENMATLYVYLNWSNTDQEKKRFPKKTKHCQSYSITFVLKNWVFQKSKLLKISSVMLIELVTENLS